MKLSDKKWLIEQDEFRVSAQMETCFTLANGYMGVRGTFEEMYPQEEYGTFIAGIYNKSEAQVTEFVNAPYFFGLQLYVNGIQVDLQNSEILDFYRALDMKQGLLYKRFTVKDKRGQITKVEGYRFLSIVNRHLSGLHYDVTPQNYSGMITVESVMDGTMVNSKNDPRKRVKHYHTRSIKPFQSQGMYMEIATRDKDSRVGIASALTVSKDGCNAVIARRRRELGEQAIEGIEAEVVQGQTIQVDKYVVVTTSRDIAKSMLQSQSEKVLHDFAFQGMELTLAEQTNAYEQLWQGSDIQIEGDEDVEKAVRFNLFHLMNCSNPNDPQVSIGAKGMHGEGYNGHVFWDTEIFMLPFFTYTQPDAAKALLMYRYNLLNAARENAAMNGYRGAQYPWESADTGKEETPKWASDGVRIWTGDIEYHITADIAFGIWQYYRATDDREFFYNYGIEIFLETARFWSSRAEYNEDQDRYEINQVIGPDEFHEHVDNNLYTNYFAKWNLNKSMEILSSLKNEQPDIHDRIVSTVGVTDKELAKWRDVADKLYITINPDNPVMEQFEGYFNLKDLVITKYDHNNMPLWPDGVEPSPLNDYTLIKQADVIMLMHLMGEDFDLATKKANFNYYEKRTMHKSSLSPSFYCLMGLVVGDHSKAYDYMMCTAKVDLANNQGNAGNGLHAASTGGTWQAAVFGFGGMQIHPDGNIGFAPTWLPDHWKAYSFSIHWKGRLLKVNMTQSELKVEMTKGDEQIPVYLYDKKMQLGAGGAISSSVQFAEVSQH